MNKINSPLGDGDLTTEQLNGMDLWHVDTMLAPQHRAVGAILVHRAVIEIRRRRAVEASRAADIEQVRVMVRAALITQLTDWAGAYQGRLDPGSIERAAGRIATRATEQLAGAMAGLNADDRVMLGILRDVLHFTTPTLAEAASPLLDRLLASPTARNPYIAIDHPQTGETLYVPYVPPSSRVSEPVPCTLPTARDPYIAIDHPQTGETLYAPPSPRVGEPGPCTLMAHSYISGSATCRCGETTREGNCRGWSVQSRLTDAQIQDALAGAKP